MDLLIQKVADRMDEKRGAGHEKPQNEQNTDEEFVDSDALKC
jgi:hypothetical protein